MEDSSLQRLLMRAEGAPAGVLASERRDCSERLSLFAQLGAADGVDERFFSTLGIATFVPTLSRLACTAPVPRLMADVPSCATVEPAFATAAPAVVLVILSAPSCATDDAPERSVDVPSLTSVDPVATIVDIVPARTLRSEYGRLKLGFSK